MEKTQKPSKERYLLQIGDIAIDSYGRDVTVKNNVISMTRTEFDVLFFMCQHQKCALTKQQIIDAIWEIGAEPNFHAVENIIYKLRKKIGCSENVRIQTLIGYGYKLTSISPNNEDMVMP